jgi:transcriptional regulator with AAA-type ATPase domain/tetratricopeptide (TPR) repeat protein
MEFLAELIGDSAGIAALRTKVRRVLEGQREGRRLLPLLIQGETGTGKGLLARSIHRASLRATGPFVDVNCAAIPPTLLEAEMFGFDRGAFTDARHAKPGLFEAAHHGTLFLDEIGLLPEALQAKFLKVIEDRVVRRLGSTRSQTVDVWVIVATNEDLAEAIRQRRFREDLYHRLAVVPLSLPPLRERGEDLVVLAQHFLARICADYGLAPKTLAPAAVAALREYAWPGNVRELSNVMERVALLTETSVVTESMLGLPRAQMPAGARAAKRPDGREALDDLMRERLHAVLEKTGWNVSKTAAILGITRNTVRARIGKYGLEKGGEPPPRPTARPGRIDRAARPLARAHPAPPLQWETRRVTALRIRLVTPGEADVAAWQLLEAMRGKIVTFGGRIEGVSPTGFFAVFGVDGGDEPVLRAGHSAIVLERVARRSASGASGPVALTIGLHTLEMSVGRGPAATVLDAESGRAAWNVLAALLEEAEPGSIVASSAAAALLRRRFALSPLSSTPNVYRVEGLWRAQTEARMPGSRFVGRREELALLESRFKSAAEGRPGVVDIVGEVGIGKSRLLRELVERLPRVALTYLEGRCLPFTTTTPFYPLLAIVKSACGIDETDSPQTVEAKVNRALEETHLPVADIGSYLIRLLGSETGPAPPIPPEFLKKRVFDALRTLLLARSGKGPVLVVVEDLQWVDQTSEGCLASLVEGLGTAPILLVFTYRTGYRPPWLARPNLTHLTLSPLLPEEGFALVREMLGNDDMARRILSRAEGNPLFLEELSRAALEYPGALTAPVPATIEEAIAARLGGLPPHSRRVLAAAAVIGREAPLGLLRHTVDQDEQALEESLEQLQRAEFLCADRGRGGDTAYSFKHVLVQEVTYARTAREERRALHLRVLDGIERSQADRLHEWVETLAHHAVEGDAKERAARYLYQAGRKAAARSAPVEAISHYRRGLGLIPALDESPERDRLELRLQVSLGLALEATRGFAAPEVRHAHGRARELCQRVEGGPLLLGALGGLWFYYYSRADYATAREVAGQHREVVERSGEWNRLCASYSALGYTSYRVGELVESRAQLEKSLQLFEKFPRPEGTALTPLDIGVSAEAGLPAVVWSLGCPDRALLHARKAIERAGELVERWTAAFSLAWAHNAASRLFLLRREPHLAIGHAHRAIEIGTDHGYPAPVAIGRLDLAVAHIARGRAVDGTKALREGLDAWRAAGLEVDRSHLLAALAQGYRECDDLAAARAALDLALAHAEEHGERFYEAELYRLRGEIALAAGNGSDASADFARALTTARAQQARTFELRAATSLHRLRRDADSRAALEAAARGFTEGFETADLKEAHAVLDAT